MRLFSIIIPVYNRPDELDELLTSLTKQSFKNFEVIIVEDGSENKADWIVERYTKDLTISYFYKENSGQGFSRNYGFERAKGDYLLVFDSDCLIPENYLDVVNSHLNTNWLDAYGGPDMAHPDFTTTQKAISYSMTSLFTTGGIRGRKQHAGIFHPRSFNMGVSKEVFEKTGGYIITRMGEDIELSIRIMEAGFKVGLIHEAAVYHKRRTSLSQFYRQLHFFGRARINISRFYPGELKLIHTFPAFFLIGLIALLPLFLFVPILFKIGIAGFAIYYTLLFSNALLVTRSLQVSLLSLLTSTVQLTAYGIGFLSEGTKKIVRG